MEAKPRLIFIPIVHTRADMGSLGDKIPLSDEYEARVTGYWYDVFKYIMSLPGIFSLKVYQDGLPNVQEQLVDRIIRETRSPNYEVVRWLKNHGATVLGTEDPYLLREEYEHQQTIINHQGGHPTTDDVVKRSQFLEQRDDYIAQRIKDTLKNGETGMLFIGAEHRVTKLLERDLKVVDPEINPHGFSEVMRSYLGRERR